ncbi:MAG: T9SS type A sorting domain-containing protein [Candidatus Cyclonatronum sp.]|uniref:T9SS type A sorting domain-containing protein n=1 Tax=Cyclonatronum sp. TaxID=3024185 RepID=UPI0025BAAA6C|nr:T9SS type A sorting domain-containing protein [Cyclonatronum sp.]MCH8487964.1 T9SS type A sorting domain-containing protein [Cyclonatronum sp.]
MKIQYSIDNGASFTDLAGYTIPRVFNNDTPESGSLASIPLPSAINNIPQVVIRFYVWNNGQTGGSGNRPKIAIDNISITSDPATVPLLAATPTTITGLSYANGLGPSASQSFTLTGSNLTPAEGTLSVSVDPDFEFSFDEVSWVGNADSPETFSYSGGSASREIFVRLAEGLTEGTYTGNITISGGGAAGNAVVSLSGSVFPSFTIPYTNTFRTQGDVDLAVAQGFTLSNAVLNTAAGGRIDISANGFVETPRIDFTQLEALRARFDLRNVAVGPSHDFAVQVSGDDGQSFETVFITTIQTGTNISDDVTIEVPVNLLTQFNTTDGRLRFVKVGGTSAVRFRDFSLELLPLITFQTSYSQNFSSFTGIESLPDGWEISSSDYQGAFGSGTALGVRGENTLGVQMGAALDQFTATLRVVNNTGSALQNLFVSYLGRTARDVSGSPAWVVSVNGVAVPALAYSTVNDTNQQRAFVLTGLNAAPHEIIEISWETTRDGTGVQKQIGLTDLLVTTNLPPALSLMNGYTQAFSDFTSVETLPSEWSVNASEGVSTFNQWTSGTTSASLLGNDNVLGFQHTSATGTFMASVSLFNDTGRTLTDLHIAYTGRVERVTQPRHPEWSVTLNGQLVPGLAYSTGENADRNIAVSVSGLSIAPGEMITLSWSSDRGNNASGASRAIGIANVRIDSAVELDNLQQLRAQYDFDNPDETTIYRVTGSAIATVISTFRNTKYFQDDTGFAIQIDDDEGIITTPYAIGDEVGFLIGTLGDHLKQLQMTPVADFGPPVTTGNVVIPQQTTLAAIGADLRNFQSRKVLVPSVEFQGADGSLVFPARGTGLNITDPSIIGFNGRFRNLFSPLVGQVVPQGPQNVIAFVTERTDPTPGFNISVREMNDFNPATKTVSIGDSETPDLQQEGWRLLSSPVQGATYADFLAPLWTQGAAGSDDPEAASNIRELTTAGLYEPVTDLNQPMQPGRAFAVFIYADDNPLEPGITGGFPKTLSLTGLEHQGDVNVSDRLNSGNEVFSLVGNPFNRPVAFGEFSRNGVGGVVYTYSFNVPAEEGDAPGGEAGGAFLSFSAAGGGVGSLTGGIINPFEGFLVMSENSSPNLTIPQRARQQHGGGGPGTGNGLQGTGSADFPALQLRARLNGEQRSQLWISLNHEGSIGYNSYDAPMLYPIDFRSFMVMYTEADSRALSIKNLPLEIAGELSLPVHIEAWQPGGGSFVPLTGEVELTWPAFDAFPPDWQVTLTDNLTGAVTDLRQSAAYTFQMSGRSGMTETLRHEVAIRSADMNAAPEARLTLTISPHPTSAVPAGELPREITLSQNYPNPFNPTTMIRFEMPAAEEVRLEVYNVQGQRVAVLVNGTVQAGVHNVSFDASALSSGVYLYRLQAGSQVLTRKMTLIK